MRTIPLRHAAMVWVSNVDKLSAEDEVPVRLCNYTDAYKNDRIRPHDGLMLATARPEEITRFRLEVGDTVLTKDSEDPADIGISAYVSESAPDLVCGYHLAIARPTPQIHPRYLTWCLRSQPALDHFTNNSNGISRYGLSTLGLLATPVPFRLIEEQRRIADFLDDRVARIDQIIAARQQQMVQMKSWALTLSYRMVTGADESSRRPSDLAWLGSIPTDWPLLSVTSQFQVDLGKMLDERRQTGTDTIPYLRNTNVQWDEISVTDLKSMDISPIERDRFTVRPGDLLICEGGQPGRAAIWSGEVAPLGYQKALHRARSRGRSLPEWLLECLRSASGLNVFVAEQGQATIPHLTNEQLREFRFPFPEQETQRALLHKLQKSRRDIWAVEKACNESIARLQEYKQSLITAAVTGEFDVTTASTRIPE